MKEEVLRILREGRRFLLTAHIRADGDAIGSLLAIWHALGAQGREAVAWLPDGVMPQYAFLPGAEVIVRERPTGAKFDATFVFDCGDPHLLPDGMPSREEGGPLVAVDHHGHYEDFGDVVLRRPASAAGEILYELLGDLGWPIDESVATCLYTAIVTDTGSFSYPATTGEVLRIAADLVDKGADPWAVASNAFEEWPIERLDLFRDVLGTLSLSAEGRIAALTVTEEMLQRTGATTDMIEGFVNFGRRLNGVEVAVLLSPADEGLFRVSLRSKGRVNVALIADGFGGGGHPGAAGCRVAGRLEDVRGRVLAAIERAVAFAT